MLTRFWLTGVQGLCFLLRIMNLLATPVLIFIYGICIIESLTTGTGLELLECEPVSQTGAS